MDEYQIDAQKLMYHPHEVYRWLSGEDIVPMYIEVSPTKLCNHRCVFCAFDYLNYKADSLNVSNFTSAVSDMKLMGVKSMLFAGEGEPLIHKDIAKLILVAKKVNIDTALGTNGVLLKPLLASQILPLLTWIKFSVDASNKKSYSLIHGTKEDDFERLLKNIDYAVKFRESNEIGCTIGAQLLLIPENSKEVVQLANIVRDIGVDYLVIKPYSQHPMSNNKAYKDISYESYYSIAEELSKCETDDFKIIFRYNTMKQLNAKKGYSQCNACNFWSFLDSNGNLWACSSFIGNDKFIYGNINKDSFSTIWHSNRRKKVKKMIEELDVQQCRSNCRMDKINLYLWRLKNPQPYDNYI